MEADLSLFAGLVAQLEDLSAFGDSEISRPIQKETSLGCSEQTGSQSLFFISALVEDLGPLALLMEKRLCGNCLPKKTSISE